MFLSSPSSIVKLVVRRFFVQVPTGERLNFGDDEFTKYEEEGVKEAQNAAFVLVAGGLGERLGYNGIKVHYQLRTL